MKPTLRTYSNMNRKQNDDQNSPEKKKKIATPYFLIYYSWSLFNHQICLTMLNSPSKIFFILNCNFYQLILKQHYKT